MLKSISVLSLLICLNLFANDGYPVADKKQQQTLLNSNHNHNHNSTTLIQVEKTEKEKTGWEKFYSVLKDWSSAIITIVGFSFGYVLIRRKLIENHITKALVDIQEANTELLSEITHLMDQYVIKTYTLDIVKKPELEEIFEEIKKLYRISQRANSGSQSTLYYLKLTIQLTIKNHDRPNNPFTLIHSRDLYGLILKTFERITFLSTQVVQIPNSTKTETFQWFNKELQPYVTNSEFVKYKSFNQGLEYDSNSALYTLFYSDVLDYSNKIFMRSAFQIYMNTSTISKFLFLNKYYAPATISATKSVDDDELSVQRLYLVGFHDYEPLDINTGISENLVKLIYTNPIDNYGFANHLTLERLKSNYRDDKIPDSGFSIKKLKDMKNKNDFETVVLTFEKSYLQELFLLNKEKMKEAFPKKNGVIRQYFKTRYKRFKETKWW